MVFHPRRRIPWALAGRHTRSFRSAKGSDACTAVPDAPQHEHPVSDIQLDGRLRKMLQGPPPVLATVALEYGVAVRDAGAARLIRKEDLGSRRPVERIARVARSHGGDAAAGGALTRTSRAGYRSTPAHPNRGAQNADHASIDPALECMATGRSEFATVDDASEREVAPLSDRRRCSGLNRRTSTVGMRRVTISAGSSTQRLPGKISALEA